MSETISEYTVRDFSAVDEQVRQIAERERIVTQKLKLENVKRALFLACAALLAVALFLFIAAIAYRIAFPPEPKIIEKVEVVEKVIEPQKIIIQTPAGSIATKNADLSIQKGQGLNKFFGKSGGDVAGGGDATAGSLCPSGLSTDPRSHTHRSHTHGSHTLAGDRNTAAGGAQSRGT